jgi:hypothetical protein
VQESVKKYKALKAMSVNPTQHALFQQQAEEFVLVLSIDFQMVA